MFSSLPVFLLFFTHVLVFILLFLSLLCHCFKVMICMYVCYTLFNKYSVILNVTSVRLSDGCLSHSTVLSETLNITTASPICVVSFLRAKFHLTGRAALTGKHNTLVRRAPDGQQAKKLVVTKCLFYIINVLIWHLDLVSENTFSEVKGIFIYLFSLLT